MKAFIGLIIFFGIGALLIYKLGGVETFDPEKQYKDMKAALKSGMTWQQVCTTVKEPKKYYLFVREEKWDGEKMIPLGIKAGITRDFNTAALQAQLKSGEAADGFVFEYQFTPDLGIWVEFDGAGALMDVQDIPSVSELVGTKQ
ncbi:MAG: hypothetical protein HJJLKODD_00183 [Phycisphaerae bacterium]|nr:hypothetical protein [Phycisphaerae bacterium]